MTDGQMAEAARRQMKHVTASHRIDRAGWTRRQWIEDARSQFGDLEGSVLDLVKDHPPVSPRCCLEAHLADGG